MCYPGNRTNKEPEGTETLLSVAPDCPHAYPTRTFFRRRSSYSLSVSYSRTLEF